MDTQQFIELSQILLALLLLLIKSLFSINEIAIHFEMTKDILRKVT